MFLKTNSKLLFSLLMLICLSIGFYSCEQSEAFDTQEPQISKSLFKQHLEDNTQRIVAKDQGNGKYAVTGEQGTRISIDNALVNTAGERVRGDIEIVLIEVYSKADMILNRKQTLANYNGQIEILESGGEVFVEVYQDGEKLSADGKGDMRIFLPTENTGGAKEDMELYYGEEVGDQVMWYPTGESIKVVNSETREGEDYMAIIQSILGWINIDKIYAAGGEEVECIELVIECGEVCQGDDPVSTTVAINIPNIQSAYEMTYDPNTGSYTFCGEEGPMALAGLTVDFIVVIECPDGTLFVSIVSAVVSNGYHLQVITCDDFMHIEPSELKPLLQNLI